MKSVEESPLVFGHPRALPFILCCQMGFGFSISGMLSIAVLYMSTYMFQPPQIFQILGFGPLRAMLAQLFGASTPAAFASIIFGLAGGLAYLTPLIGGVVSDRFMTRRRAVMFGAALCALGQLSMAVPTIFLIGLVIFLAGVAFVGVNIAAQLGELYERTKADLADAFQAVHICINLASILGPLVCGTLAQTIAWRWGYVAAAAGMLMGLAGYTAGLRFLPEQPAATALHAGQTRLQRGDGKTIALLLALLPPLIFIGLANGQIENAYLIWGSSAYRLQAFGHAIPVSWLVSADACFSVAASVAMLAIWRGLARSNRLPGDLTRIAIGAFIAAAAPLVLALASAEVAAGGRRVSLAWAVAFHIIDNIGMAAVWPVASAMFARLAPRPVAALMMGALNFDGFGGALAIGFLGTLLGRMTGVHFWLLQSGLVAIGALAVLLLRRADDRYSAVARAKSYQSSPR